MTKLYDRLETALEAIQDLRDETELDCEVAFLINIGLSHCHKARMMMKELDQ